MVERQLPKLNVAGSIPVSRSKRRSRRPYAAVDLTEPPHPSCTFITRQVIVSSPWSSI